MYSNKCRCLWCTALFIFGFQNRKYNVDLLIVPFISPNSIHKRSNSSCKKENVIIILNPRVRLYGSPLKDQFAFKSQKNTSIMAIVKQNNEDWFKW